jgi:uncharacterized membrane protein
MRTPASIAGHPIHAMLVTIPVGLYVFSLVCDLIHAAGSTNPAWPTVALYTMGGGIIGSLLAAIPGLVDLLSLPPGPRSTGIKHMTLNLTNTGLYIINLWRRVGSDGEPGKLVWLSVFSVAVLVVAGWLGAKMVYESGVGVSAVSDNTRR